jgi:lipid-binding SYLF domain-containing protein
MKTLLAVVLCVCAAVPVAAQSKEDERLAQSATVLKEIVDTPDKGIPMDLLHKAYCVVVFPSVKKAGFIFGASYGRGVMTCHTGKDFTGPWGAPSMMALEGGSFGLQVGAEATDFVLVVMNDKGATSILSSKVKLGADASTAAGPVGLNTSAETDAALKAQILSYSRAKGVFAGVSLEGSTLRPDNDANKDLYGKQIEAKDIVLGDAVEVPAAAKPLIDLLQQCAPRSPVLILQSQAAGQHSNVLTWSWSQGTGDPATGFHIWKATTSGGYSTTPFATISGITTLTFTDAAVAGGETNFYVVTAFNSSGDSSRSNEASSFIPLQPPEAPSSLSAKP